MELPLIVVLVQDVDAGIYGNTAEQHEAGKPSLVEVQLPEVEGKEDADVGDGNL